MYVTDELNRFGKYVKQQARNNLTRKDKNASKDLYDSIKYDVKQSKNSFQFSFSMEDYGTYIDKGVKGVGGKKADGTPWKKKRVTNNSFKYTNKRPPAKSFDKWMINKGIAPRNKKGQFQTRKGMQFAIATSVFHTGLETTNFFTLPFERAFKRLPDDLVDAYGLDVERFMETALKNG